MNFKLTGCRFEEILFLNLNMRRLSNHLLFWGGYIFFKVYLNITADTTVLIPASAADVSKYVMVISTQLVFLFVKVPLVYSCFFCLNQFLENKWNRSVTIATIILLFGTAVVSMTVLNHQFVLPVIINYHGPTSPVFDINSLLYHFFTLAFVVGAASSLKLLRKQYHSRLKETVLQKEKTEAELKYLKGQINPHFLFNTLNNIYSLARKQSEATAEAVMKLSKLMRFMLYEAGSKQILLLDELKLIEDYISLEKLRYASKLNITFQTEIDNPSQTIAPLLLIHFVENAFKHGASESRFESSITIRIIVTKGVLQASIKNSKEADLTESSEGKIGLNNIKRQLELIYPLHKLTMVNEQKYFTVELTIPLNDSL